jgi:cyclase
MIHKRIIPCLLISGKKLVKTIQFKSPKYIGDPMNAVKIFNDKEVDEILILDIEASVNKLPPQFDFLQEIVAEAFVPVAYGGGIGSMEHVDQLFKLGIEKICINSANAESLDLISKASQKYGAQSVVAVIDVKSQLFGGLKIFFKNGLKSKFKDLEAYIQALQDAGAGEILIQSVDRDGTFSGYDLGLIQKMNTNLKVPLIVLGGASKNSDFSAAMAAGADAVAAGSLFVFHGPHRAVLIQYPDRHTIQALLEEQKNRQK